MREQTGEFSSARRTFLRMTACLAATGAALTNPLLAFANTNEPDFVSRSGMSFTLHNNPFYFAGMNNYYLHYQSHLMIDDVLKNAVAMGLSVIRLWGFLDGQPTNGFVMQSSPGVYPEDGYERFDYTVSRAAQLGLKLVVVLVNNWKDFGGMDQYVSWFGGLLHDEFYTDEKIKSAYKQYVQHFLHRINRYTGRQMLDEPAIMTWELANEPRCQSDLSGNTLVNWVNEMSSFIKGMDSHHLVAVGDEGFYSKPANISDFFDWTRNGSQGVDWKRLIALPTIDYGTLHLYPDTWLKDDTWALQWIKDHIQDAQAAGKPVVLEEYGWKNQTTRDTTYQSWLNTFYQGGGNGDLLWILTGIQDDGTLYPDYDGFRVTYPSSTASVISAHAAQMKAKSGGYL